MSIFEDTDVLGHLRKIKLTISTLHLSEGAYLDLCIKALSIKNSIELSILKTYSQSERIRLNQLSSEALKLYYEITSTLHPNTHFFHISIDSDVKNYCSVLEMVDLVSFSKVNKCCYAIATKGIKLRYRKWYDIEPFEDTISGPIKKRCT